MAADIAIATSGVIKLNNSNYNVWRSCIKSYLEGQDLWGVVDGDDIVPPKDVEELKKWNVRAGKVMYVLKTTITDEMLDHIEDALTPKEAWDAFVALFSKKNDVRRQVQERRLTTIRQRDDDIFTSVWPRRDKHASTVERLSEEIRAKRFKLYRAALNGDWRVAKGIFDAHKDHIRIGISKRGDTALHIAAAAKRTEFVKELLNIMEDEDLTQKNDVGATAFTLAVMSGVVELAKVMMNKNKAMAKIEDYNAMLPIERAASLGHKEMVEYLYQETKDDLDEVDRIELLITLIKNDLYDVAWQLLQDHSELATARNGNRETALHVLARKHLSPSNAKSGSFRRCFNLGAKETENKKLKALELVQYLWEKVILKLTDLEISELIVFPTRLISDASKQGNVEFLSILICEYPDLVWKVDENKYTIFHIAVLSRQEDIFKLIYEMGSTKDLIVSFKDKRENNILHLAGMLAPPDRLNVVPGAALQLQRELLWFKEVSKVVQPTLVEAKNKRGLTPKALFAEQHEKLREKGEEWMKNTATSCMLVATLIATVVFAAAFTLPGGNDNTGQPFLLQKVSFKIFAISDAVALVFSCISIVSFLSILTSRYAQEDFLSLLPRKLRIGLIALFVSIVAMMVVFSTTFLIIFTHRSLWIAILVTAFGTIPAILFIWHHFALFLDVVWVSECLFQHGKSSLFRKVGEVAGSHQEAMHVELTIR